MQNADCRMLNVRMSGIQQSTVNTRIQCPRSASASASTIPRSFWPSIGGWLRRLQARRVSARLSAADVNVAELIEQRPGPIIATVRRPDDGGRWNAARGRSSLDARIGDRRRSGVRRPRTGDGARDSSPRRDEADRQHARFRRNAGRPGGRCIVGSPPAMPTSSSWPSRRNRPSITFASCNSFAMRSLPTVGLCMGRIGMASRVLNGVCGSPFTLRRRERGDGRRPGADSAFEAMRDLYRYESLSRDDDRRRRDRRPDRAQQEPADSQRGVCRCSASMRFTCRFT